MRHLENPLVVTRHNALIEVLESDFGMSDMEVLAQATPEQVKGRHVVGILPIYLAAHAASITVLNLNVPVELRGQELTADQIREMMGDLTTYKIETLG